MFVGLGRDDTVFDWLDAGLVVVLVDFAVDGGGGLFACGGDDAFFDDRGLEVFTDFGVVMLIEGAGSTESANVSERSVRPQSSVILFP